MAEVHEESIFEAREEQPPTTEAGVFIANTFSKKRLSRTEQQGLAFPGQPEEIATASSGDPARLAEELQDLAREAGIRLREIGEE